MGGAADNTPTTYELLCSTLAGATATWPIIAGALSDLRENDVWKQHAGQGETWGEFLAQLPGEPMGQDKAGKLIQLYREFHVERKVELVDLAKAHWSNVYVTLSSVKKGLVAADKALADAAANIKGELEALYADIRSGDTALEATDEPHKCICPDCGAGHRRRKTKPEAAA